MTNPEIKNFSKDTVIPTSLAPWLSVRNCKKAVDFYKTAFGALETYRLEMPDGELVVAKLSIDGAEFWLSEESSDNSDVNPGTPGVNTIRMILTVTDPDGVFAQALEAGASQIFPVGDEHGWRLGRLADPFGHHWEIGRPLNM
jgi:PhnB protein